MMPSHVIADELGLGEAASRAALQSNDPPQVDQIAAGLEHHLGPQTRDRPRSASRRRGPTRSTPCCDDGAVVLVANDRWWGAKPITKRITVWPRGVDVQDRVNNGTFDVVDVATGSSGTLTTPDDYERTDSPSGGIEQLIFAPQGPLAAPPARRALALCTPRDLIARNAETADRQLAAQPGHRRRPQPGRRSPPKPASSASPTPTPPATRSAASR